MIKYILFIICMIFVLTYRGRFWLNQLFLFILILLFLGNYGFRGEYFYVRLGIGCDLL